MTTEIVSMKSWWFLKIIKQRTVNDGDVLTFGTRMRHPLAGRRVIEMKFTVGSSRHMTVVEVDPQPLLPVQQVTLTEKEPEFILPGALMIRHLSPGVVSTGGALFPGNHRAP